MASLFRPPVSEQSRSGGGIVVPASAKSASLPKSKSLNNGLKRRPVLRGDSIEYMTDSSLDSLPFIDDEEFEELAPSVIACKATSIRPVGKHSQESLKAPSWRSSRDREAAASGTNWKISQDSTCTPASGTMGSNPLSYPSKILKSPQDITSSNAQVRREMFRKERQKSSRSREEHIQTWRKVTKKLVVAKKVTGDRKKMKRMWKDSYTGMCNRARVLDEVVSEASKHGIKIKPLHGAANLTVNVSDDIALIKKPDKKYIGLGRKFYGFRNPKEDLKDPDFSSLAEAQCDIRKKNTVT